MRAFPLRLRRPSAIRLVFVCLFALACTGAAFAQAQSNASDLQGNVSDPQGGLVPNATVTARNKATGLTRTAQTNDEGFYQIINLPPGEYEVTVEAANFSRANLPSVVLTVGQRASIDVPLQAGQVSEVVTISGVTADVVETSRTAVANTIEEVRIDNLPINQRGATDFALTISTVGRDNGRPIGPAPTSGINIGGQRGRSTLVQIDGADNTDNSINASRSTVSQEAVQEFQVVTNSYAPEFGRTSGGVINVVTKGGTNDVRGNIFGFLRHRSYQARNAFAPVEDPPFTRAQYGATLGGPLVKDNMFYFLSFEQRRRQETGFFTSNVVGDLTDSVTIGAPFLPFAQTFSRITQAQGNFIRAALASATPARISAAIGYAFAASSGGTTALNAFNPLVSLGSGTPVPAGQVIGSRFLATGQPVPFNTINAAGLPAAFRPLLQLQRVFPISEDTTFSSIRLDHSINEKNQFTFRASYNPSEITGIQNESQNQSLGQNDVSRTGIQKLRDFAVVTTVTSTLSNTVVNEARFNFGSRNAEFLSQNNDSVAVNIVGTAFFGRELFSPVVRQETRFQFTDYVNVVAGNHNFKFGGDAAHIGVNADFQLNFAGRYNFFGGLVPVPAGAPQLTPVQHYGLGIPSSFVQGFGNPVSSLQNKPYALFVQDSWKIRPNFTINYGVRYDYEQTDTFQPSSFTDPLTGLTLSAADIGAVQDFFNVQQGFPRDKNNIAPRAGFAWDITGDGKTVVRGAFGLFYDHPLLAIAFNSDIA
ncbi:MAG: TonB-dependent receptor domain-containing protein, partial [Pyrinomonadaceae bacterium]